LNRTLRLLALAFCLSSASASAAEPFELKDGDRVVFLGNTFIERDQEYGHLETLLNARYPDRNVTFRNLGWSGDTVWGEARAGFGTAEDGFNHLREHVLALKPTVIFVGYGANESFDGESGLPRFRDGLKRLLDTLAETKARIIILSPIPQEDLGRPLPDPARHNADLRLYRDALREAASGRGYIFIDLYESLARDRGGRDVGPLTDDGLHLTAYGYWRAAMAIASGLGIEPPPWSVALDGDGTPGRVVGTEVSEARPRANGLRFVARDASLPAPPFRVEGRSRFGGRLTPGPTRELTVRGLASGGYTLTVDGTPVVSSGADLWADGVPIPALGPEFDQAERLRQAIIEKNRLYFYRWRPQNETYLFGFRKHEQGQNAREVPRFDPLVAEQEAVIARLRVPVAHTYELVKKHQEER
jgi:lysophospholipase L1-like esterase